MTNPNRTLTAALPRTGRVRPYAPPRFVRTSAKPTTAPPPSPVRPYLVAAEHRRHLERTDRNRLGVAVLLDIAAAGADR